MLESAATHVYANCGLRRVIPLSDIDSFLVHHLPNTYVGRTGATWDAVRGQIDALTRIEAGSLRPVTLCPTEPSIYPSKWGKRYDEQPTSDILELIGSGRRSVLSIGCGSGDLERQVLRRGASVTVLPLDCVAGSAFPDHQFRVVLGTLDECLCTIADARYDCVVLTNLIHLLPRPEDVLERLARLLTVGGCLIVSGLHFDHLPVLLKRAIGFGPYGRLRSFQASGIHTGGRRWTRGALRRAGLRLTTRRWTDHHVSGWPPAVAVRAGGLGARGWILAAERIAPVAAANPKRKRANAGPEALQRFYRRAYRALFLHGVRDAARLLLTRRSHRTPAEVLPSDFDARWQVYTDGDHDLSALDIPDRRNLLLGTRYQPTSPDTFDRIMEAFPGRPQDYTFIDCGAGKGRVLLMASSFPFRRIIGVEFASDLTATARDNVEAYRNPERCSGPIEIVCSDATCFALPPEPTLLYLYNPFGGDVMRRFVEHVEDSLRLAPRPFVVIYREPQAARFWDRSPAFTKTQSSDWLAVYTYRSPVATMATAALAARAGALPSMTP
jgi:SAM-dependent methyltransferase